MSESRGPVQQPNPTPPPSQLAKIFPGGMYVYSARKNKAPGQRRPGGCPTCPICTRSGWSIPDRVRPPTTGTAPRPATLSNGWSRPTDRPARPALIPTLDWPTSSPWLDVEPCPHRARPASRGTSSTWPITGPGRGCRAPLDVEDQAPEVIEHQAPGHPEPCPLATPRPPPM